MAENKLLTETNRIVSNAIIADLVDGRYGSIPYANEILAKIREVVEDAGLTEEKITDIRFQAVIGSGFQERDGYILALSQAVAQAQLQAILKAIDE